MQQARLPPGLECLLCAVHCGSQLCICTLWDASDEVVRCGVVEVDPLGSLGGDELIVEDVVRFPCRLNWLMGSVVTLRGNCGGGLEVPCCSMETPYGIAAGS